MQAAGQVQALQSQHCPRIRAPPQLGAFRVKPGEDALIVRPQEAFVLQVAAHGNRPLVLPDTNPGETAPHAAFG